MTDNLNIGSALKIAQKELAHEAKWFISFVCDLPLATIITSLQKPLSPSQKRKFNRGIALRKKGVPLAYIIGIAPFAGEEFLVNKNVLIPREDSEVLVNWVISTITDGDFLLNKKKLNILELGVGSGALMVVIAKAIAKVFSRHNINIQINYFASDISKKAIATAEYNFKKFNLTVQTFCGKWFSPLQNKNYQNYFDLIYSNPPYIAKDDPHLLSDGLIAEPKIALTDNSNGLTHLEHIINNARFFIKRGGYLGVEHGCNQASFCKKIFLQNDFQQVESLVDGNDILRVCVGKEL